MDNLDRSEQEHSFAVWAYVLMPDHVHLLVWPTEPVYGMAKIRQAVKQPVAKAGLARMREFEDPRLSKLHDGRKYRFWQPGGGYDRNTHSSAACRKSIDYIHDNPVAAGLCASPYDWSGRAHAGTGATTAGSRWTTLAFKCFRTRLWPPQTPDIYRVGGP